MGLLEYFNFTGGFFDPVRSKSITGRNPDSYVDSIELQLLEDSHHGRSHQVLTSGIHDLGMSAVFNITNGDLGGNLTTIANTNNTTTQVYSEEEELISPGSYVILVPIYTATTCLAIVGNCLAIAIFATGRKSRSELRPFLINLAIADLIMAIFCIPFTFTYQLLDHWVFSSPMCPIVMFCQTVSVTGSVSTNMAIGIDRFCAVTYPLKSRITATKYGIIILIIWIISIGVSAVNIDVGETVEDPPNSGKVKCIEIWPDEAWSQWYTIFLLILTYAIPLIILTVTYSIVGCLLWRRKVPGVADATRDQNQLKSKRKIVKMLVTVVVLFALCWLPLHVFWLVLTAHSSDPEFLHTYKSQMTTVYFVCHWIAMSNSFVNPIIYGFLNDNFRADLNTILFKFCPFCHTAQRQRHGAVKWKRKTDNQNNVTCNDDSMVTNRLLNPTNELTLPLFKMGFRRGGSEYSNRSDSFNSNGNVHTTLSKTDSATSAPLFTS